jgi:hypothetical protein
MRSRGRGRLPGNEQRPGRKHESTRIKVMSDDGPAQADYTQLDDSALIARRREVREQLEREPPNMAALVLTHHLLSTEVIRRTAALRRQAG